MMGQTALPPFQASYQEMKLNKTDYQDNFTTSNRMTYDFIKNSSTVAARQVLALNNKICSRTPSNYVHPL